MILKFIKKLLCCILCVVILSTSFLVPQAKAVSITVGTAAAVTAVVAAAAALGYVVVSNSDNWNLAATTWANEFVTRFSSQVNSQLTWIKVGAQVFAVWSNSLWKTFTDWIKGKFTTELPITSFRTTYSESDFVKVPSDIGTSINSAFDIGGNVSIWSNNGNPAFIYRLSNGYIQGQTAPWTGGNPRGATYCPYLVLSGTTFYFHYMYNGAHGTATRADTGRVNILGQNGALSFTGGIVYFNNHPIATGYSSLVAYMTSCFNSGNWILNVSDNVFGTEIGAQAPPQVGIDYYPDRSTSLDNPIGRDVVIPVAGDWVGPYGSIDDPRLLGHNDRTGTFTGNDVVGVPDDYIPTIGKDVFNPSTDDYAPTYPPTYPYPIPVVPPYGVSWPTAQPKPGVGYPPTVGDIPFPNVDVPPTVSTRPGDIAIPGTTDISDSIPNVTTTDTTIDIDIEDTVDIPDTETFPENPPPSSNNDNTNKMKLSSIIIHKFPFCIPIDFYNAIRMMVVDESPPEFEYTFDFTQLLGQQFKYELKFDFAKFDTLASVVRWFFSAMWIVALILLTRKLIWK